MKKILVTLLFLLSISAMGATQATPFVVTDFPAAIVHPDSSIWIKWTGKQMDSATIYFSRKPGGSNPANYEGKIVAKNSAFTNRGFLEHGIQFKPSSVSGMGSGIYYLMVASSDKNYSNEIKFIVKTTKTVQMISPIGQGITNVTPSFRWTQNPEVPYYHVIVTDEKINIGSNNSIEGLSVIWQAITADDQIVYGAPDPSGTITATPPPLSPGLNYSWFVLNNYGNNAALSAMDISLPGSFTLLVDTMKTPKLLTPVSGDTLSYTEFMNKSLKLRWTNLDSRANTYKVYLYAASEDTALDAQLVLWDGEVTAGQFTGTDTAFVEIDARNILTSNNYTWKVIAVDASGKGQASKGGSFRYNGLSGGILAKTYERISTSFGIIDSQKVGLCEIKVEVLDGSMEKPLLFYTDQNGFIYRGRPVGTYRLTAVKDGYRTVTKTVTITEGDTTRVDFFLERPEASIFGAVFDDANSAVNIAKISGISTLGDTLRTETDPSGNFVLNCGKGDWDIYASKSGYISPVPTRISVDYGESKSLSSKIVLKRNSFALSGLVTNSSGTPLVAARVVLKDEFGTVVGELPSTSSSGQYSFSVNPGTYTLAVTKTGFTSWSETFVFASTTVKNISLASGAAQIKGSIYGRNWSFEGNQTIAAIRNLTIRALKAGKEVASALTDVWGSFTLGVTGDGSDYTLVYEADGFIGGSSVVSQVGAGKTVQFPGDTLNGLANVYSYVYYSENAGDAQEIQVSLLSAKDGETVARGKSDNSGIVELYKIPDGEYIVKAAGNNYFTDKITMKPFAGADVDTNGVTVKNGRLMLGTTPIQQVRIGVAEGKGAVTWSVNSTVDTSSATVKILSPLVTSVKEGDTLSGIGLDTYRTEINMIDPRVVDCSKHLTVITENSVVKLDTITLPFWHVAVDSIQMNGETVSLAVQHDISKFTAGTIKKAELFYRPFGSAEFMSDTAKSIGTDSSRFDITGVKSETVLEYYFQITLTNGDVYGYSKELYRSYMKADPKVLSRLEIVPQTDSAGLILPMGGTTRIELRGYYGDKYAPVGILDAAYATWNATGVSLSAVAGEGAVSMVTGTTAGKGTVSVTFNGGTKYTLGQGVNPVLTIPVTTTEHPLSTIKISKIGGGTNSYVLNSAGAQFTVEGTDKSGTSVVVTPTWTWSPDSAGTVAVDGKLTPAKGFVGRIQIAASAQDTIRDQLVLNDNSQAGIQIGYAIQASGDTLKLNDGYELSIVVPDSSVAGTDNVILTVEHPEPRNTVKKAIPEQGISLVSRLYEIQRRSTAKFREDSLTVTVDGVPTTKLRSSRVEASLKVPEQYRSLLDASGSKFTVAVWDEKKLAWQHGWNKKAETRATDSTDTLPAILNTVKWNSADSSFSISVGEELNNSSVVRLAVLLNETEKMEGDFQVSPNPFSPYVSPVNDYWFFGDTVKVNPEDMKGTCLKITPMNSTNGSNPNVAVNIYTANRSLVWEAQLNGVIPGKEYYLFWDGKTRIGRSSNADIITVKENTPIRPEGDEMCRNGRYFAVVVIDDGKEKKRFTKEIILFK